MSITPRQRTIHCNSAAGERRLLAAGYLTQRQRPGCRTCPHGFVKATKVKLYVYCEANNAYTGIWSICEKHPDAKNPPDATHPSTQQSAEKRPAENESPIRPPEGQESPENHPPCPFCGHVSEFLLSRPAKE